ncbi:hypothetical protein NQ317_012072 [Molorchus minor]|uniref:Uncharacterized protein n=1 Tax=Molorchus minor TaxID=1323400 RepID=A0ABQ9K5D8_9CUCU|nr:hypothetical protein NQ317_012072 [Molorchus minor]
MIYTQELHKQVQKIFKRKKLIVGFKRNRFAKIVQKLEAISTKRTLNQFSPLKTWTFQLPLTRGIMSILFGLPNIENRVLSTTGRAYKMWSPLIIFQAQGRHSVFHSICAVMFQGLACIFYKGFREH